MTLRFQFRLASVLALASLADFSLAREPVPEERPNWSDRGNVVLSKDFVFQVDVRPNKRTEDWNVDGWTQLRAVMELSKNGAADKEPKIAISHRFTDNIGYAGRPHDALPIMGPRRIEFPPAYLAGKEYYLPIMGRLFRCGEPYDNEYSYFVWIPQAQTPKGIPVVRLDSLCIPQRYQKYPAGLSFEGRGDSQPGEVNELPFVEIVVATAKQQHDGKKLWEAEIECVHGPLQSRKAGKVTVREGDILVVPSYGGFVVRHIVPYSEKTLAIGWVDLDCHIIEEKDLAAKAKKEGREIVRFDLKAVKAK